MPKYIANAYLVHNGKIVQADQEVELTAKQAELLGEKVTPVQEEKPKKETKDKKESK